MRQGLWPPLMCDNPNPGAGGMGLGRPREHHGPAQGAREAQQEPNVVHLAIVAGEVQGGGARGALLVGVDAVVEEDVGRRSLAVGARFGRHRSVVFGWCIWRVRWC